jgi:hypothetical protein
VLPPPTYPVKCPSSVTGQFALLLHVPVSTSAEESSDFFHHPLSCFTNTLYEKILEHIAMTTSRFEFPKLAAGNLTKYYDTERYRRLQQNSRESCQILALATKCKRIRPRTS